MMKLTVSSLVRIGENFTLVAPAQFRLPSLRLEHEVLVDGSAVSRVDDVDAPILTVGV